MKKSTEVCGQELQRINRGRDAWTRVERYSLTMGRMDYNSHLPNPQFPLSSTAMLVPLRQDPALGKDLISYQSEVLADSI